MQNDTNLFLNFYLISTLAAVSFAYIAYKAVYPYLVGHAISMMINSLSKVVTKHDIGKFKTNLNDLRERDKRQAAQANENQTVANESASMDTGFMTFINKYQGELMYAAGLYIPILFSTKCVQNFISKQFPQMKPFMQMFSPAVNNANQVVPEAETAPQEHRQNPPNPLAKSGVPNVVDLTSVFKQLFGFDLDVKLNESNEDQVLNEVASEFQIPRTIPVEYNVAENKWTDQTSDTSSENIDTDKLAESEIDESEIAEKQTIDV